MMFNRLPPKVMDSATIMMMLSTTGRILQQGTSARQPDNVAAGCDRSKLQLVSRERQARR